MNHAHEGLCWERRKAGYERKLWSQAKNNKSLFVSVRALKSRSLPQQSFRSSSGSGQPADTAIIRPVCRKLEISPLVGPASRLGYPIFMEIRSSALIAQTAQISYLRAIHTGNTTRASKLMGVMICHQLMALRQKLTIAFALWTEQDHPPRVG